MAHTATPWTCVVMEPATASMGPARAKIIGPMTISHDRDQFFLPEDGKFIVKAVNAYDRLIAFLKSEREEELKPGYPPCDDLRIKRIDDLLRELGE